MTGVPYERRTRTKGSVIKERTHMRHFSFEIDRETFEQAAGIAHERRIPLGQLIREYVEWGLENDEAKEAA